MGGFPHFGIITQDFLMLKGCIMGLRKRVITLRKTLKPQTTRNALEQINLKFIDTSSKLGVGSFQTTDEKYKFLGRLKKHNKEKSTTDPSRKEIPKATDASRKESKKDAQPSKKEKPKANAPTKESPKPPKATMTKAS
jgi:hypothetical protein